jgi:hypothetical protein
MSNPIRFVAAKLAFSETLRSGVVFFRRAFWSVLLLWAMFAPPKVGAQNVMHVPTPTDNKPAIKSELAPEPVGSETPPTLRIVIALALGAAVVAVVCIPSRKGGGDER